MIPLKWVLKVKNDGRFRARLVVLGYRQRAGIDFNEIHAPVMHEVALRILIIIMIMMGWKISYCHIISLMSSRRE